MRALAGIIIISSGLGGCFNMPILSKGTVSTLDEAPRIAATVSYSSTKSIAAYDPSSKVATTIPAPSGALSGSSVTLPAGALAIAADLVVEEAVPLSQTSLTSSLSISSSIAIKPVGSGLIIRPTENVNLTQPMTIAMPIDPTVGLHGWLSKVLALNTGKYYTVFYKYFLNGELKAGAFPSAGLRFSEDGLVLFDGYFGAYWLAELNAPIEEKVEVNTDEPIVNKDNVSVVTNTGVVSEAEVLVKTVIPPVEWTSVSLSFDATRRAVMASASVAVGQTLSSCQLDLFETLDAGSGINIDTGSALSAVHVVTKQEAHNLYARFRCLDEQGRLTMSAWSAVVAIPGIVTPVVTSNDFCSTTPPELRLFLASGNLATTTTTLSNWQAFQAQGSCVYTIDVDTLGSFSFGIQTADGMISCAASTANMGEQTLTCGASTGMPQAMFLQQGNYTFTLDFSASTSNPKLAIALQSCALGDLYLVSTNAGVWSNPDNATNRMNHLGGCQYAIETASSNYASFQVRIQNLNGTYACGDTTTLNTNMPKVISCGASGTSFAQMPSTSFTTGYRYLLNLGSNLDMNGQPTSTPYLWLTEIDKCMHNIYLLGPTPAGNSRVPGINSFKKGNSCNFDFSWIQNGATFAPFYIGVGDGTEKCGVAPATTPGTYVTLDCSATADPIDMQSYVFADGMYRLSLTSDSMTGKPTTMNFMNVNNLCVDAYYAVKKGTSGFYPDVQKVLTEVKECIFEYDWTPTANDRNMMFIRGNWPGTRCGKFFGLSNPTVGGPAVEMSCRMDYAMSLDFPITPSGVVDGNHYKVRLDFRLDIDNPKVSIANHSATACPDLYVLGLDGLTYPDLSTHTNRMTKVGDCNYAFNFQTPVTVSNPNFHIADSSNTIRCGSNSVPAHPGTGGQTVPLECSAGTPSEFAVYLSGSSYYQIQVHYESAGNSAISISSFSQSCMTPTFDGPAAADQNTSYGTSMTSMGACIDELLWVPTTTTHSFRLVSNYYGYPTYCGLDSGSLQVSLSGVESHAICNIFDVGNVTNFAVVEGVSPSQQYRIRLDRSGPPYNPPKISVVPEPPP